MLHKAILTKEVQQFIQKNQNKDIPSLILKGSPFEAVSIQEIAIQIKGRQVAEKKLPLFYNTPGILYPPKLNLEQTSSQITAAYKAGLIAGNTGADLTGGLGIDSYFLSRNFSSFHYYESNEELATIAAHNFEVLKASEITVKTGNSLELLRGSGKSYDWIFLDPARRNEHGGKVYRLSDCTPDVAGELDFLLTRSKNILVKTSPILDLTAGLRELKYVKEIHIIAVNNEVKELLWIIQKDWKQDPLIKTINFQGKKKQRFEVDNAVKSMNTLLSTPQEYIYEPNAAIMKSGLFTEVCTNLGVYKLHEHSHLYTSSKLRIDFPGRKFQLIESMMFNDSYLKKKLKNIKANVSTRNFPESVENLRKKFKIKDGGNTYVFFTTNRNNEKIVLFCKKPALS